MLQGCVLGSEVNQETTSCDLLKAVESNLPERVEKFFELNQTEEPSQEQITKSLSLALSKKNVRILKVLEENLEEETLEVGIERILKEASITHLAALTSILESSDFQLPPKNLEHILILSIEKNFPKFVQFALKNELIDPLSSIWTDALVKAASLGNLSLTNLLLDYAWQERVVLTNIKKQNSRPIDPFIPNQKLRVQAQAITRKQIVIQDSVLFQLLISTKKHKQLYEVSVLLLKKIIKVMDLGQIDKIFENAVKKRDSTLIYFLIGFLMKGGHLSILSSILDTICSKLDLAIENEDFEIMKLMLVGINTFLEHLDKRSLHDCAQKVQKLLEKHSRIKDEHLKRIEQTKNGALLLYDIKEKNPILQAERKKAVQNETLLYQHVHQAMIQVANRGELAQLLELKEVSNISSRHINNLFYEHFFKHELRSEKDEDCLRSYIDTFFQANCILQETIVLLCVNSIKLNRSIFLEFLLEKFPLTKFELNVILQQFKQEIARLLLEWATEDPWNELEFLNPYKGLNNPRL